ncbi:MAG TPA: hypothetical protein VGD98_14900 [Ktedonobacteraceae bacterium]
MYNQPDPLNAPNSAYEPNAPTVPIVGRESVIEAANNGAVEVESQRASYVDPAGYQVENQVETYADKNASRAQMRSWIISIIYFLLGVLEVIMGLRFIFRLLGANSDNAFIMALYSFSHAFVGPFSTIFNNQSIGSRSFFEWSTLVAMLIYALIAWGLAALARVALTPNYGAEQRVVKTLRRS